MPGSDPHVAGQTPNVHVERLGEAVEAELRS
jgi:hypothetical protein